MAGIAIALDLLRKNPSSYTAHSSGFLSAAAAASAAAASVAAGTPYAYKALFGNFRIPVVECDAGAAWSEDYASSFRTASEKFFQNDVLKYSTKEYKLELKPLFSAFEFRTLAMTTLRSFLLYFLPLLEPRTNLDEDDDDFLQEAHEEQHVDYVVPLKKSVKQICRETTIVTTRRILERIAVHHVSQRMAWKLLKDVPKSATRKAGRRMPTHVFFFSVSKTTFRGHILGVAASWIVQVAIEIYRFFNRLVNSKEVGDEVDPAEQVKLLGKKLSATTIKCSASLVFASVGAGIGAVLFRPSAGQWIGCAIGDLAGPVIVSSCIEKVFHIEI
ncbi:isopentenyl-diphosphate delta-isomerase [Trema orientale]|uniref:Isopentenyl-diphosphate delta-isomerase n=1 Tax=Trema orientale TaxID=63057 RepID=A0A2P5F8C0_TREOI|nr:isopentenyl-diphosphate delta-isomerase [Trema orientale]